MSKAEAVRKAKACGDDGDTLINTGNSQSFDSSVDMPPLPTSDYLKSSIKTYASMWTGQAARQKG